MKKHITYLVLLILITSCSVHKNKEFGYNLPHKTIKLTPEEFALKKEFQSGKISDAFKKFYLIQDTVILGFTDMYVGPFKIDILEEHKKDNYNLLFHSETSSNTVINYTSNIEKFGDNQVLIEKYDSNTIKDKKSYYHLEIMNSNFTKVKIGIMQFPKEDEKKATAILNTLLKNFQVK